jgi:hypothetical protein
VLQNYHERLSTATERIIVGFEGMANMNDLIQGITFDKCWEYENGFYLTSHPSRIAKSIMHWEIYKQITNLPGVILECGVFKGASLIRFATYREMLESPYSRKVIGFDAFGKFPSTSDNDDSKFISRFESEAGDGISKNNLESIITQKAFNNIELIEGNVLETLPLYVEANPHLKIALLHIDVDVYDATKCCLEYLFDKVVMGGIIILDDYSAVVGATKAIDEFIMKCDNDLHIQKNPFYSIPCYIVKR